MGQKKIQKLGADCEHELYLKIIKACQIEKRSLSNFIRLACEEKAENILEVSKNE
jgi:uncharacterized protein (DUF1778 family)